MHLGTGGLPVDARSRTSRRPDGLVTLVLHVVHNQRSGPPAVSVPRPTVCSMFALLTDPLKKLLTLGLLFRIATSTALLDAVWGWRTYGTRPIPSMITALRFLGVPATWLNNVELWWQAPGRAALM